MKRKKKKSHKLLWGLLIALPLLAALAAAVLIFVYPWMERPSLGKGNLEVYLSGTRMSVTWPVPEGADVVRLYRYEEETDSYVLAKETKDNSVVLNDIVPNRELRIRLVAVRHTTNRFGQELVLEDEGNPITILPTEIARPVVESSAHVSEKSLNLAWDAQQGDSCAVYQLNENQDWQLLMQGEGDAVSLKVGEELMMPKRDEPMYLAVRVLRKGAGYTACSGLSEAVMVLREDLLSDELALALEQIGEQKYALSWEEAQGDIYELQQWSDKEESWVTVKTCDVSEELRFETGRVTSGMELRYRVIDHDRDSAYTEGESVSKPGTVTFRADITPLYCTVWPIKTLELLKDAQSDTIIDRIAAGTTLCVLGEENERFYVRYQNTYGYVEAGYCLINLPEYMGNLVDYEIANSYSSIFKVHGYHIPEITGTVIQGYETIQTQDGDFLVPYLYPCAKRLIQAARAVQADGYCLRIYDAFRPHEATRYLYDSVMARLDWPVQEPPDEEELSEDGEAAVKYESRATGETENTQSGLFAGLLPGTVLPTGQVVGGFLPDGTIIPGVLEDGSTLLADGNILPAMPGQEGAVSMEGLLRLTGLLAAHGLSLENVITTQFVNVPGAGLTDGAADGTESEAEAAGTVMPVPMVTTALSIEQISEIFGLRIDEGYLVLPETKHSEEVSAETGTNMGADTGFAGEEPQQVNTLPPNLPPELQAAIALRVIPQEYLLTYRISMTDHDRFRLGSFLAAVASAHNRGIALDLTLEDKDTGENLEMQSDMHDLSRYSIIAQNNENAALLASYMKAVGYQDLSSEWWHFQDDDTREELNLNTYLEKGVSVEGWKKDDSGWRYRLADGSFYYNTTQTIDGRSCTFDAKGYCPGE